jgi:hypothetical protein
MQRGFAIQNGPSLYENNQAYDTCEQGAKENIWIYNRGNNRCWIKLHNDKFNHFYSSDIIRMTKTWWARWDKHVACTGEKRNACKILVGKPEGKKTFRCMHSPKGNMEWILNKLDSRIWTGFIWLMTGTNGGRLL